MNDNSNPFGQPDQPTSSPAQPELATNPSLASSTTGPANLNQPAKSYRRLIIGAVAIVLLIVAVAVGSVVYISLNKVSSEDYKTAINKLTDVKDATDDVDKKFDLENMGQMSETEFASNIDGIMAAIDKGQKQLDQLGKLKAIVKTESLKTQYDDLKQQYATFNSKSKELFEQMKQIVPVYLLMIQVGNIKSTYTSPTYYTDRATGYQQIADKAKAVKLNDQDLAKAMKDVADSTQTYADYYTKLSKNEATDYSAISSANSKLSQASSKLSRAFTQSDVSSLATDVTKSYQKLSDDLSEKYSDSKNK